MTDYKILYVSYARAGRGDEVHTRQFAAAARRCHGNFVVHTPRITEDTYALEDQPRAPGAAPADPLREMRWLGGVLLKKVRAQVALLRKEKPDVVIMRSCRYLSLVWLCRLFKIPIVLEVNAPMWERTLLERAEQFRGIRFWCRLEAALFGMADHVMVVSEPLRRYYLDYGLEPARISVVPNGVDIAAFSPDRSAARVRTQYGLSGKIVIGFVGSFAPWHGLDGLVQALREGLRRDPGLRDKLALLLVGKRSGRRPLPAIEGVQTIVTGKVPHAGIPDYLAAMDIIAAPYPPIEPFYFSPLKVYEGMAMGKPVVASGQGQINDLIAHGSNGLLYAPGDPADLLRQLLRLIENPDLRADLGRKARRTIAQTYTWDINASRIVGICNQLLE
jgi:glycosyltransferase involved in cell wall biosynthesis